MNSLAREEFQSAVGFPVFGRVVAAAFLALATACATVPSRPPEEIVRDRAQARWNALVQGDAKAAYEYFSPGSRATFTLSDFVGSIRIGFWKAVQVDKVMCEGADKSADKAADRCEVHTTIEYDYNGMRIKTPHREEWIRDGQDWWFLRR